LEKYAGFEVISECENGFEGIKMINEQNPDLIFLDIKMPKITGFEMLELLDKIPAVIFSTAYDEFAIKAFEMNAADYLLKPYSKERFHHAIQKAKEKLGHEQSQKLQPLIDYAKDQETELNRIVVRYGSKIHIFPTSELHYIEAQDDYVKFFFQKGSFLKQGTMKYYEEHLPSNDFVRIHRSYILNLNQLLRLEPFEKESFVVVLKVGGNLPVSRSGYSRLKEVLNF
jgi:two-component system LytT family response regulator